MKKYNKEKIINFTFNIENTMIKKKNNINI